MQCHRTKRHALYESQPLLSVYHSLKPPSGPRQRVFAHGLDFVAASLTSASLISRPRPGVMGAATWPSTTSRISGFCGGVNAESLIMQEDQNRAYKEVGSQVGVGVVVDRIRHFLNAKLQA